MKGGKKRNKLQEKQVLHTTIAHHQLINVQLVPRLKLAPPGHLPAVYVLGVVFCIMEYPFVRCRSAVLAMLLPSRSSLTEHRKLKSP